MTVDPVEPDGLRAEINVTPLVDVMLVLLVIFMVMTPLLRRQLPVELPLAAHGAESRQAQVTLTATGDGTILLDARRIDEGDLGRALADVYATRADKTIFLEADRSLPYGRVVELMDACRAAGVERIGVLTKAVVPPPG